MKKCLHGFNWNRNNQAFTLIEILIVVMVLGILAMAIIPQIVVSVTDAKESTLATNITGLRNAIELYYVQHDNTYPGANSNLGVANADADDGPAATAFVEQLTQYTDINGKVAAVKDAVTAKFGPYIKTGTLPTNPFNDKNTVVCDMAETSILIRASAAENEGWKFYPRTGVLIANDGAHDAL